MSDKILRGVMFDKSVRFTAISAKEMVEAARKTHNLLRGRLGTLVDVTANLADPLHS